MPRPYTIHAIDLQRIEGRENLGSKRKFWLRMPRLQGRWLFKYSRPLDHADAADLSANDAWHSVYTGEHWSEKIAAEIAEQLGVPHAEVELAHGDEKPGVIVRDLTENISKGALIHGNELLAQLDPSYPKTKHYRTREHTVDSVLSALHQPFIQLPQAQSNVAELCDTRDLFVGYLLLDALIGNTDRHHENWALLNHGQSAELAPSYDHASSLGRELRDETRKRRLETSDPAFQIKGYANRARSALYGASRVKPLSPVEAFRQAGARHPQAACYWLERLRGLSLETLEEIVSAVPDRAMSAIARAFALHMLRYNYIRLLELD